MITGHSTKILWQEKARLTVSSKSRVDKWENHDENYAIFGKDLHFKAQNLKFGTSCGHIKKLDAPLHSLKSPSQTVCQ